MDHARSGRYTLSRHRAFQIRPATTSDIAELVVLNELVQALHVEHRPEEFKPLDPPTESERADILSKIATAGAALVAAQILDPEEVANSFFGSGKLSLDIKLDAAIRGQLADKMEQMREPGPSAEEVTPEKGALDVGQPA